MILVYDSPNIVQRRALWRDIVHLSLSITVPWCLGGDLNATLGHDEGASRGTPRGPDREFCKFVEDVALNDLGFIGPPFTWKLTGVESRLDRVLGSTTWQENFPNAVVKHLNWYKNDHRPLLLQLDGVSVQYCGQRPFRFLAAWVLDERTILLARRVVRLSHKINSELDTQLESHFDHSDLGRSDCVHSVDLSDCASDSISDSLVVFTRF
ncbi:hypothetical protein K1719_044946 [Acacia pycnantha]|nr:hypothetical protein K1719_044946 [Acacia pycnantha]